MDVSPAPSRPPAGWYPDPEAPDASRWWDGERWTEDRRAQVPPADQALPGPSTVAARSVSRPGEPAGVASPEPAPRLTISALWPAIAESEQARDQAQAAAGSPDFAFTARPVAAAAAAASAPAIVADVVAAPAIPAVEEVVATPAIPAVEEASPEPVAAAPAAAPAPAGKPRPRRRLILAAPALAAAVVAVALVAGSGSDPAPSAAPAKRPAPAPKTGLEGLVLTRAADPDAVKAQLDDAFTRVAAEATGRGYQHTVDCHTLTRNEYTCTAVSTRIDAEDDLRTRFVYVTVDPKTGAIRPRSEL